METVNLSPKQLEALGFSEKELAEIRGK